MQSSCMEHVQLLQPLIQSQLTAVHCLQWAISQGRRRSHPSLLQHVSLSLHYGSSSNEEMQIYRCTLPHHSTVLGETNLRPWHGGRQRLI